MEHKLRINSYNCRSLNSNAEILQSLLKDLDILCLQETLTDENNHDNLVKLDPNLCMHMCRPFGRQTALLVGQVSYHVAEAFKHSMCPFHV